MRPKEIIPDRTIDQRVTQELSARGMRAPCSIAVHTTKGVVTLSGNIAFEHQRNAAVQATRHLDGVTRVIDQMHVKAKTSPWKVDPPTPMPAPAAPTATEEATQEANEVAKEQAKEPEGPQTPPADVPPPVAIVTAEPPPDTPVCP
jgi:hypothetical protein